MRHYLFHTLWESRNLNLFFRHSALILQIQSLSHQVSTFHQGPTKSSKIFDSQGFGGQLYGD